MVQENKNVNLQRKVGFNLGKKLCQ